MEELDIDFCTSEDTYTPAVAFEDDYALGTKVS